MVENVCGAQKWVGRARWHFGSFDLWGDVPALMPIGRAIKNTGGSWFNVAHNTTSGKGNDPHKDGTKCGGDWFGKGTKSLMCRCSSKSSARKAASAMIAKIPFALARHVAESWKPRNGVVR